MSWKLWLDDLCELDGFGRETPEGYIGAKSSEEAKQLVLKLGEPEFMSLDHDLGEIDTTMIFLKWLANEYPGKKIPGYKVHSANPVGKENIISYMESWIKFSNLMIGD